MELKKVLPNQLKIAIQENWPLLIPAGCIEYHGPYLPLGTDSIIVEELCYRIAKRIDCIVAPTFYYGPTGYAVSGPEKGTKGR